MSEHYDFHYQPTGSGAISGQQVLEQTEDAINELGDYVNDNVGGAMDVAQQALETAQNAEQDAQTALDTANSFSSAIQSAQQDASTALSTAQTAQTTASNANNTAIQAQQDVSSAVTTANNALGQVSTLSGTVTALGQRVTTAEGNIGQNTSDITALTTRVGTAEGNITTLQNDVTIAQGNASSAMATAGTVKQQAFVFRYSSTALTPSSTNSNALLDNTDNLKVGDKVIDSDGVLFSITAIDTANSTFTIGTALVDLAQDSDVVHKSGNETISGNKTFTNNISLRNLSAEYGVTGGNIQISFSDKNNVLLSKITQGCYLSGLSYTRFHIYGKNSNNQEVENYIDYAFWSNTSKAYFRSNTDNFIYLGTENNKWKGVYATNYYYGSNNVEFSTKFVTTDTAQTISGAKTFSSNTTIYNSDSTANSPNLILQSSKIQLGDTSNSDSQGLFFNGGNSFVAKVDSFKDTSGTQNLQNSVRTKDASNNVISAMYRLRLFNTGLAFLESNSDNTISLGRNNTRWKDCQTYQINGLTPSSLGMPVAPSSTSYVDISGYITVLDSSNANTYTPPSNGYITFSVTGNLVQIFYDYGLQGKWSVQADNTNRGFIPVLGGVEVKIYVTASSVDKFWFIPCQGNV